MAIQVASDGPQRVFIQACEPLLALGIFHALKALPGLDVRIGDDAPSRSAPHDVVVRERHPEVATEARVVMLSRRPRGFEIRQAIGKGVLGYVSTACSPVELESAVRAAAVGQRFLCRDAAREMADSLTAETLTDRERGVLALIAGGACNKVISARLDIALGTVKAHVRSIMAKLDARSRTEAATIGVARGLLPVGG